MPSAGDPTSGQWFESAALRYYAGWFDSEPDFFTGKGVRVVPSSRLGIPQPGHSTPLGLLCYAGSGWVRVAHARVWAQRMGGLQSKIEKATSANLSGVFEDHFRVPAWRGVKFYLKTSPTVDEPDGAFPLEQEDLGDYRDFFAAVHPRAEIGEWLDDYFYALVGRRDAWAIRDTGILAAVTDAPDLPWMGDLIVEPGINTRPEFRRRGYAARVCGAMIRAAASSGRAPIWSCGAGNTASQALAQRLGFHRFVESYSLPL